MLARQILLPPHSPNQANPFFLMLLQPLWSLQKSQLLWNQSNPASFCKTPRVGVPLRKLVRCIEAQKYLSVSPLHATLTHSVSRKSFPCHSYANTRDGGASAPTRHPLLPTSHAPRGASIPCGLTRLRILPVTTGVYPLRASGFPAFVANPIGSPFVFIFLRIAFPATPFVSHPYKSPGGVGGPVIQIQRFAARVLLSRGFSPELKAND